MTGTPSNAQYAIIFFPSYLLPSNLLPIKNEFQGHATYSTSPKMQQDMHSKREIDTTPAENKIWMRVSCRPSCLLFCRGVVHSMPLFKSVDTQCMNHCLSLIESGVCVDTLQPVTGFQIYIAACSGFSHIHCSLFRVFMLMPCQHRH